MKLNLILLPVWVPTLVSAGFSFGHPWSLASPPVLFFTSCWLLGGLVEARKSADDYLAEAKNYLAQHKDDLALQSLSSAVQVDESNYLTRFKRAVILISIGMNSNAIEDLDIILKQKPDFDQALLQRAKIYLRNCNLDSARADIDSLASTSKNTEIPQLQEDVKLADSEYKAAKKLLASSKPDYAKISEMLNRVATICSHDGDLRMTKAEVLEKLGEIIPAIGEYSRATTMKANNIPGYLKLATLYSQLGEIESATASVKGCLKLDPEHKACMKHFKQLKKISKALDKAQDAIGRNRFREALGADALNSENDGESGVLPLLKTLNIQGLIQKQAMNLVCMCYTKLKRADDALKWCSDAIALKDNDDVDTLCNLGEAQILKEQFEEAARTFAKAQEAPGGQQNSKVNEGIRKAQKLLRQAKKKDYYKVLGISRDATDREIKKAYKTMALKYHPDKYDGDAKVAEEKMSELNQAYGVLSNEELKQRYDAGDDPNDPTGGQDFHGGGGGFPFGGGHPFFQQGGGGGFGGGGGQFSFHF